MALTLAERISSARSNNNVRINDLQSLIGQARDELARLSEAAIVASRDSVNFALSDEDRDDAAVKADRYTRTAKGLDTAIGELVAKLEEKRESEAQKLKQAEQKAALEERDRVAARIAAEWPGIVTQAVELFKAIKASDAKMRATFGVRERCAESVARCGGHLAIGVTRLVEVRLPALAAGETAWPPPEPSPCIAFNYGQTIIDAQRERERQAAAAVERAKEHAQRHGQYRLSTGISGVEPFVRLPTKLADSLGLPRAIYLAAPWEGELAHEVADQLRKVEFLNVTSLEKAPK